MRTQVTQKIIGVWSLAMFVLGSVSILSSYLDGIFDVCCPQIWRHYLAPFFFFLEVFWPILIISFLIIVAFSLARRPSNKRILQVIVPFLLLIAVWILANSLEFTRMDGFPIGGKIRLWLTENPEAIRKSAIELSSTVFEEDILYENLPKRLQSLGVTYVEIDEKTRTINAHIFTAAQFATQGDFGYLFLETEPIPPLSEYSFDAGRYKLWKLQDGIYFYQNR